MKGQDHRNEDERRQDEHIAIAKRLVLVLEQHLKEFDDETRKDWALELAECVAYYDPDHDFALGGEEHRAAVAELPSLLWQYWDLGVQISDILDRLPEIPIADHRGQKQQLAEYFLMYNRRMLPLSWEVKKALQNFELPVRRSKKDMRVIWSVEDAITSWIDCKGSKRPSRSNRNFMSYLQDVLDALEISRTAVSAYNLHEKYSNELEARESLMHR